MIYLCSTNICHFFYNSDLDTYQYVTLYNGHLTVSTYHAKKDKFITENETFDDISLIPSIENQHITEKLSDMIPYLETRKLLVTINKLRDDD